MNQAAARRDGVDVDRVSVIGVINAGKTTLARTIGERCGLPVVELDAIYHQPGWTALPDDEFMASAERIAAPDRWVVEGSYTRFHIRGPIGQRAQLVVWLDFPLRITTPRLIRRTARRIRTHEELWNGNRESFGSAAAIWKPGNLLRWQLGQHRRKRRQFAALMWEPTLSHARIVRLRTPAEVAAFVDSLPHRDADG